MPGIEKYLKSTLCNEEASLPKVSYNFIVAKFKYIKNDFLIKGMHAYC